MAHDIDDDALFKAYVANDLNLQRTAKELGIPRTTARRHLVKQCLHGLSTPVQKPRYTVSTDKRALNEKVRIIYWTDSHDSPYINKDRFRWLGRYVHDIKPDIVVHGGDISSFDSLCRHEPNDTLRGREKPSYDEDIQSLGVALDEYRDSLGSFWCDHHATLGNHEDRILSFLNRNPELTGFIDTHFYTLLSERGWTYSPYGMNYFVAGTAFVHVPINTMGKPYGGLSAENSIARDSLENTAYGHSHKRLCKPYPKSCDRHITIINGGCFMPQGHIEAYAKHTLTGWTYGFYDLTIRCGQVSDRWVSMDELQEMYG